MPESRLRILHVSPYYAAAWAYGGIPRVVGALARGCAEAGHSVTVCTTDVRDAGSRLSRPGKQDLDSGPWRMQEHGVEVRVFPNISNHLAYKLQLFLPRGLQAYLAGQAHTFDICHIHACRHLLGAVAARHLRRRGVPYVLSPHGTAPRIERRQTAKWIFDQTIGRNVVSHASRLFAVTAAERRQLAAMGISSRSIRILPNPVDLTEFDTGAGPGAFRRARGVDDSPLVLFLGKLTPRKLVDVLIHAFALLGRPDARLVIAGNDMGSEAGLRALVERLELTARTLFTGLLTGGDRLAALRDADVVAYPSRDEIFGLVPIEAILCGTPVVVCDDSGCGEIVSRTGAGLLVPPGDPVALATAIGRMLDERPAWRRAAAGAQHRVRAAYGRDAVCAELEELYREVLGAGG